jgi:trehalose/maltose hydrolase-like predicted phosphorylase
VNAAIAYNVWQYHEATGDMEFLAYYGAEMLVEIARFWASIATYHFEHDRYEIRGVIGPDEFHTGYPDAEEPGLNNNAYTNVMAAWVLRCASGVLELLDEERRDKLRGGAGDRQTRSSSAGTRSAARCSCPFTATGSSASSRATRS